MTSFRHQSRNRNWGGFDAPQSLLSSGRFAGHDKRKRLRQKKRWGDNIEELTGMDFGR